jgi:hypothetical protein
MAQVDVTELLAPFSRSRSGGSLARSGQTQMRLVEARLALAGDGRPGHGRELIFAP